MLLSTGLKATSRDLTAITGDLRARVLGGAVQPLDLINDIELIAMREMLVKGEARIVNSAGKPYLVAKLNLPKY